MARRTDAPRVENARDSLVEQLRTRLESASTRRVPTADGKGWFESNTDRLERQLGILDRGEALTLQSWELPEPWKHQWKPPRAVTVHPDGAVTRCTHGRS